MDSRSTPFSFLGHGWLGQLWDKHPRLTLALSVLWLTLICWIAFFWHLGSVGLIDETEPLFAEAARQMTVTGDWITPYFNGDPRFDKPPLIYWLMAIAYQTLGVNEWAVRLPSALSATALTVMGFYVLRRFGFASPGAAQAAASDRRLLAAWIGAALIAMNGHTLAWARTGVSDMLLSGCMGTALFAFFCGYAESDRPRVRQGWYFAFYTLTALAVLAKGPVGFVLPGLTVVCFLAYTGNLWTVLREMKVWWGTLWFLLLTLPWYILVTLENGSAYIDSFFGYHNVERFTQVVNNHGAPWYFYFIVVLIGFFPSSLYLPVAIARLRLWQRRAWLEQPRTAHLSVFAVAWFGVIFVFFTIAVTKLPSYVLPLMPAAAVLVALGWTAPPRPGWAIALSHGAVIVLSAAVGVALLLSPALMGDDPAMPSLPEVVQQTALLPLGTVLWVGSAIVMTVLVFTRRGQWLWGVQLFTFTAFLIVTLFPLGFIVDDLRQAPLRHLSTVIVNEQRADEPVIMLGFGKPSLVFYTQRSVLFWHNPTQAIPRLQRMTARGELSDSVLLIGYPNRLRRSGLPLETADKLDETEAFQLFRLPLPLPEDLPLPPPE
jgi:4-amino-4-deoxy-L-arabinose transferase-like glycosyltransferase